MSPQPATLIKASAMPPLRRLVASCEGRTAITGEPLALTLLPSQVAIRGMFLARSTVNAEMSALRAMLQGMAAGTDDPNRNVIIADHAWLSGARVTGLSDAIREASAPPSAYGRISADYAAAFRRGVRGRSLDGLSDEELLRQVSGVRKESPHKVRNKENRSLLWRDYLAIMMDLSEHDPEEAMTALTETGAFSPGVARVMIATLYLTGVRPAELFGLNLYVPRTDIRYTPDRRGLTRSSPISAIHEGLMRPVDREAALTGLSRGNAVVRAARMTGAAPVLSVLSAKQQNANRDLRFPVRFLVLDGISAPDAHLLAWAVEFRRSSRDEPARRRLTGQTSAVLRAICAANPEMRQDVTLYTFRHSFASRVRAALEEHECSALTGHTAARTFRGYGERVPKRTGRGWLPAPDPERAGMIQQIWDGLVITPEVISAEHAVREVPPAPPQAEPSTLPDAPSAPDEVQSDQAAPDEAVHDEAPEIDPDDGVEVIYLGTPRPAGSGAPDS